MNDPVAAPLAPSNAFMTVLQKHQNGEACQELADAMRKCVEAVRNSGKAASLTLKVTWQMAGTGAFVMEPEVSTKMPKSKKPSSLWFADSEGNLYRENPEQRTFDLTEVKKVAEPSEVVVRKVS